MNIAKTLAAAATLLASAPPLLSATPQWQLGPFTRPAQINPIIKPDPALVFDCPMQNRPVQWAALHTFNPAAIVNAEGRVCVLYRAEDASGASQIGGHTSRIALAESDDGLHFTTRPAPVLYPADDAQKPNEWKGGCEDPRIVVTEDGTYVMTYTEYHRDPDTGPARTRLAIATSKDLLHWDKHGPAFAKHGGEFATRNCKSGAILTRLQNGRLVAAKLQNKYWMYWGEGEIRLATSDDLINWTPGPVVMQPRPNKFDSALVESGPPALLTDHGIVLIYNGKNAPKNANGDPAYRAGVYSGGQALFDAADPTRLLQRTDTPFYKPEADFERTGQYGAGTTFLEGLVYYKNQWHLYYGCADSYVAVAVAPAQPTLVVKYLYSPNADGKISPADKELIHAVATVEEIVNDYPYLPDGDPPRTSLMGREYFKAVFLNVTMVDQQSVGNRIIIFIDPNHEDEVLPLLDRSGAMVEFDISRENYRHATNRDDALVTGPYIFSGAFHNLRQKNSQTDQKTKNPPQLAKRLD